MGSQETVVGTEGVLGRIDRYELLKELGGGGFGCVFLARDTVAGIEVAVKGLPPLIRQSGEELERIRDNFALVSRLHHPHIAPALHLHEVREVWYARESTRDKLRVLEGDYLVVMAYAPGVTLSRWRKQFPVGKVPLEQALDVCRQVAEALDYAHSQKIIHRDVKPSNIMVETLTDGGVCCRVLDFGLAAEVRSSLSRVSSEVTDTSGTRPYMAPEQWKGEKQDSRTDQYALAVLYYELVSGEVPFVSAFETGDPVVMERAVTTRTAPPLDVLDSRQNRAVSRALAKQRKERFGTCGEFVKAVGGGVSRKRHTGLLVAAVAVAVVAVAYASYRTYMSHRTVQEPPPPARQPAAEPFRQRPAPKAAPPREVSPKTQPVTSPQPNIRDVRPHWTNSLGMVFISVPGTEVLFGKYEVTNAEYRKFKHDHNSGEYGGHTLDGDRQPVVGVSWDDAKAFCKWLTEQERRSGGVGPGQEYRLPHDLEWSVAVGLNEPRTGTPKEKDEKSKNAYPWGREWPPPHGAGNYEVDGYRDAFPVTAPVGSFAANGLGIHDLGGNVWEWCEDWYDPGAQKYRVLRGASWYRGSLNSSLSSARDWSPPGSRGGLCAVIGGFRVVLSRESTRDERTNAAQAKVTADLKRAREQSVVLRELRGPEAGKPLTVPGLGMEFVLVAAGTFKMGSNAGDSDEKPIHTVRITRDFWMGKCEATQAEYEALMGKNPSYFKGLRNPVECVRWEDAAAFCVKLTERERMAGRLPAGCEYRLPTEAELEYAARGGTQSRGFTCAGSNNATDVAWYNGNSATQTRAVGQKAANELGLYDMSGNVWGWCLDWYDEEYYKKTDGASDPMNVRRSAHRARRGGCWDTSAEAVRSASRGGNEPSSSRDDVGFRVCLVRIVQ